MFPGSKIKCKWRFELPIYASLYVPPQNNGPKTHIYRDSHITPCSPGSKVKCKCRFELPIYASLYVPHKIIALKPIFTEILTLSHVPGSKVECKCRFELPIYAFLYVPPYNYGPKTHILVRFSHYPTLPPPFSWGQRSKWSSYSESPSQKTPKNIKISKSQFAPFYTPDAATSSGRTMQQIDMSLIWKMISSSCSIASTYKPYRKSANCRS